MSRSSKPQSGKSAAKSSPTNVDAAVSAPPRAVKNGTAAPASAKGQERADSSAPRSSRRAVGVRLLLVGLVVLVGLAVALASGALRAGKLKPAGSGVTASVPVLGKAVNGTFTGKGITFDYPKTWSALSLPRAPEAGGTPEGRIVLGSGSGSDRVIVEAFRLQAPIIDASKPAVMEQVGQDVTSFANTQHGTVEGTVQVGSLGTLPAFTARATWPGTGGVTMDGRFYFGYQGYAIYYVNCQSASTAPAQVSAGCDQIVDTFRVA